MDGPTRRWVYVNLCKFEQFRRNLAANHIKFTLGIRDRGFKPTAEKIDKWLAVTQDELHQITLTMTDQKVMIMLLEAIDLYLKRKQNITLFALSITAMHSTPRFADPFRSIASNAHIRVLKLCQKEPLTITNVQLLAEVVRDNPFLEALGLMLKLNKTQLAKEHTDEKTVLLPLMRAISALPRLKVLSFVLFEMPSAIVGIVSRILASSATIQDALLCVRNFTTTDGEALARAVVVNNSLDHLVLDEYIRSTYEGLQHDQVFQPFCDVLRRPLALRKLEFSSRDVRTSLRTQLVSALRESGIPPAEQLELWFLNPYIWNTCDEFIRTFNNFSDIDGGYRHNVSNRVVVDCSKGNVEERLRNMLFQLPRVSIKLELRMPDESDIVAFRDRQDEDNLHRITSLSIISPAHNALDSLFRARPVTRKRVKQENKSK
jgi:hypothetical protein